MVAKPKVLYIVGWGRSGTTLMDNVLGSHEGIFTAGEITRLWELGLLQGRRCGCGAPVNECPFWDGVFAAAFERLPDPAHILGLQKGPLSVMRTPALVAASRKASSSAAAQEYADVLSHLYQAIAAKTGARVIVDASKRPSDAVITAMAKGVEPYLLHMVRDARACAFSWQRSVADPSAIGTAAMHRHGRLMNAGHWVSWNVLAEQAARAYPAGRTLRVRYEDFMSTPRVTMAKVFDVLGEQPAASPFVSDRTVHLAENHTIAGNPSRFRRGDILLRLDDEWREAQRRVDRSVTTALSLPWLRRYGYPVS